MTALKTWPGAAGTAYGFDFDTWTRVRGARLPRCTGRAIGGAKTVAEGLPEGMSLIRVTGR
jgi:hypothetical protein